MKEICEREGCTNIFRVRGTMRLRDYKGNKYLVYLALCDEHWNELS